MNESLMGDSALMDPAEDRRGRVTRRTPFHVWARRLQRVAEEPPRKEKPVLLQSHLSAAGSEKAGRPRANRAEDWSRQPPEEGCLGLELFLMRLDLKRREDAEWGHPLSMLLQCWKFEAS